MTVDALNECNKRDLAQLAKSQGIAGWHAMRKDQLIRALSLPRPTAIARKIKPGTKPNGHPHPKGGTGGSPAAKGRSAVAVSQRHEAIQTHGLDHACQKDRIVVLTRDSYWLHAYWELSRTT